MTTQPAKTLSKRQELLRRKKRVALHWSAAGFLVTLLAGWLGTSRAGDWFSRLSFDLPYTARSAGGSADIVLVEYDQYDKLRRRELDRAPQGPLLEKLNAAGVRMVLYDLFFDPRDAPAAAPKLADEKKTTPPSGKTSAANPEYPGEIDIKVVVKYGSKVSAALEMKDGNVIQATMTEAPDEKTPHFEVDFTKDLDITVAAVHHTISGKVLRVRCLARESGRKDYVEVSIVPLPSGLPSSEFRANKIEELVFFDFKFEEANEAFAKAIRRFQEPVAGRSQRRVFLARYPLPDAGAGVTLAKLEPVLQKAAGEAVPVDRREPAIVPVSDAARDADGYSKAIVRRLDTHTVVQEGGAVDKRAMTWLAAVVERPKLSGKLEAGPRWINYAGPPYDPESNKPPAFTRLSASEVLAGGERTADALKGRIVIVGAPRGFDQADLFATPFHRFRPSVPYMSGPELHANVLNNLLREKWLTRSSPAADWLLIVCTAFVAIGGLTFLKPYPAIAVSVAAMLILAGAGTLTMHCFQWWFPWAVPALVQIPTALLCKVATGFYVERWHREWLGRDEQFLRDSFGKFVPADVLDEIIEKGGCNPGGERKIAMLCLTSLSRRVSALEQRSDPERAITELNRYFASTAEQVLEKGGSIIKFHGERLLVAWGAPLPRVDDELQAVRTAWRLHSGGSHSVDGFFVSTRLVLHRGEVLAGLIGSTGRMEYTLLGDPVELAAQLVVLHDILDTGILLTAPSNEAVSGEFLLRCAGSFRLRSGGPAVKIYEVRATLTETAPPGWIATFHHALSLLKTDDDEQALPIFTDVFIQRGEPDGVARFYLQAINSGLPIVAGTVDLSSVSGGVPSLPGEPAAPFPAVNPGLYRDAQVTQEILAAAESGATALNLAGRGLTALPSEIGQCVRLRKLFLQDNTLTSLPAEIAQCKNLQKINLAGNAFSSFPVALTKLPSLTWLSLADNDLSRILRGIHAAKSLTMLDLSRNELAMLPAELGEMPQLRALFLHGNYFRHLPEELLGPPAEACHAAQAVPAVPRLLLHQLHTHRPPPPPPWTGGPIPMFVSYAHKGAVDLAPFRHILGKLERDRLLAPWVDHHLLPGTDFKAKIMEQLGKAYIILLLVSEEFMASTFIRENELPAALDRAEADEAVVVWVKLDDVLLTKDSPDARRLLKLESGTTGKKPIKNFSDVSKGWEQVELALRKVIAYLRDTL
jgi:class 3 adenylate cyclase/CHASE2 domain-containing sensor protein